MLNTMTVATSTAAICIFDPVALAHRLNDTADWWSDPDEEKLEMNSGNVYIAGLREDGIYNIDVEVRLSSLHDIHDNSLILISPSGKFFIGPAEDITGGGLEPSSRNTTGKILVLPVGKYLVNAKLEESRIFVYIFATDMDLPNHISEGIYL